MTTITKFDSMQESCRVVAQPRGGYAVQIQKFVDPSVILGDIFGSIQLARYPGNREVRRFENKELANRYIARRAKMLQVRTMKAAK